MEHRSNQEILSGASVLAFSGISGTILTPGHPGSGDFKREIFFLAEKNSCSFL
ncbi:hypothetical protein LFML04_1353 [Leptospirillum ferriphilum ML-04]|uniref:Uncharacterized protein n=1 Tax=Leptospirillum ferriphilum (strain ML-04) TaxID=1048260 RepID=J9ZCW3_LEPFM|nr:hypothetical protein LFML04_1353 [Leptospirillum ferriphilum ML-04]